MHMLLAATNNTETEVKKMLNSNVVKRDKVRTLTVLQTCDVHSQCVTHPEFFREND